MMKATKTLVLPTEAVTHREYERSLRLSAARTISLAFAVLLTLFILGFTYFVLTGTRDPVSLLTDGALGVSVLLFLASVVSARWQRLNLATAGTVMATNLTIITFMTYWAFTARHYFDPITLIQFASLDIAIILAGALGAWWLVVATTLFVNGFSFWLIAMIGQQTALPTTIAFFMLIAILQQWTVAALALTISGIYRRILNDLGRAYAQAQQLDTLKDQFITHVNHELRTPIMALHGYVEFLQMTHATLSPEEAATALNKASRSGYNLIHLLNSILDVRRIDTREGEVAHEVILLRPVIEEALNLIDPRETPAAQAPIHIQVAADMAVIGDQVQVQQILTNLLSNARKYAPDAPIDVTAEVGVVRHQQRHALLPWQVQTSIQPVITLSVRDYGPGIPPDQLPLLFNRFVRLPRDLASSVIGNGLGLYLCRVFATAMQGQIWAESTGVEGEGTTFLLQLPAATDAGALEMAITQPRLRRVRTPSQV